MNTMKSHECHELVVFSAEIGHPAFLQELVGCVGLPPDSADYSCELCTMAHLIVSSKSPLPMVGGCSLTVHANICTPSHFELMLEAF